MSEPNISSELIELLNFRISQEEYSSRLYLSMSVWLDFNGYSGAAKLWKKYSNEEQVHAEWAYKYLLDLNAMPVVPAIPQPTGQFESLQQIIVASKEHEVKVTSQCQELAKKALAIGDFMTVELAQRYLKEQAEELGKTQYWIDRLEAFGTHKTALRLLDDEMGEA